MLALHTTTTVPEDHVLRLALPNVKKGEEVEVLVLARANAESFEEKIERMATAAKDPLYQDDLREIARDFTFIDSEHL